MRPLEGAGGRIGWQDNERVTLSFCDLGNPTARFRERRPIVDEDANTALSLREILGTASRLSVRLTRRLVASYWHQCSADSPSSLKNGLLNQFRNGTAVDPEVVTVALDHYGNERLVDGIDEICRRQKDPWRAAHETAADTVSLENGHRR